MAVPTRSRPQRWVDHALWIRMSWWFRFAHEPLCDRRSGGVLRVGRAHVCRSCLAMYAGALLAGPIRRRLAPGYLPLLVGATVVSIPQVHDRLPRRAKDLGRATIGVAIVAGGAWSWERRRHPAGLGNLAGLLALYRVVAQVRARRMRHACDGCPEQADYGVCSGFTQQAEVWRDHEEIVSVRFLSRC